MFHVYYNVTKLTVSRTTVLSGVSGSAASSVSLTVSSLMDVPDGAPLGWESRVIVFVYVSLCHFPHPLSMCAQWSVGFFAARLSDECVVVHQENVFEESRPAVTTSEWSLDLQPSEMESSGHEYETT